MTLEETIEGTPTPPVERYAHRGRHAGPMHMLALGALGVVFGDIGTSPLYAMCETVSSHLSSVHGIKEKATMALGQYYGRDEVLGFTSLFVWAIALVVTLKYVVLILRADNEGEGGMFSILALLKAKAAERFSPRAMATIVVMAVVGSGLILGDGVITPSLSIMSAWEGLEVVTHRWSPYIPWLSVATLVALFSIQRFGTHKVGAIFAPAMAVWFLALAAMGAVSLSKHLEILAALDPRWAGRYMAHFPKATLYVIGSVDLGITGCEALFADMGHFSRPAVRRAWFSIVWPALLLNYLGQGARMLDPEPIVDGNVFYALVPSTAAFVYPLVAQAVQLGLCPRASIVHTNAEVEGQIYVPEVNWGYLVLCVLLVVGFKNSHNLAPAYGLAVTGTMAFTTILFYLVATRVWHWRAWLIGPVCLGLIGLDILFFVSNATQFLEGGYITIAIAMVSAFVMLTWQKGRAALGAVLRDMSLPTDVFLESLRLEQPPRVKGTAVFMTSNAGVPNALLHYFKHAKTLHETVVLLRVKTKHVPEIAPAARFAEVTPLGEGFFAVTVVYGFMEMPDVPAILGELVGHDVPVDPRDLSFFLGRESLVFTGSAPMSLARKMFFKFLSQNAIPASAFFKLPPGRVIELGVQIEL